MEIFGWYWSSLFKTSKKNMKYFYSHMVSLTKFPCNRSFGWLRWKCIDSSPRTWNLPYTYQTVTLQLNVGPLNRKKSEFHFLLHGYIFLTLITPLNKIHLDYRYYKLWTLFYLCLLIKLWSDDRGSKISEWWQEIEQIDMKSRDKIVDGEFRS
jgi:hypothetical protein